jgi:hypothetical protein
MRSIAINQAEEFTSTLSIFGTDTKLVETFKATALVPQMRV